MNIFVYGDESGVFDKAHNDLFVFAGLIFLDKASRDIAYRKYIHAEKAIAPSYPQGLELKASVFSNKHKAGLFRSTNSYIRYALVVHQQRVLDEIFSCKKSKQRYLDYVYKVGLKKCFQLLIKSGQINPNEVENIYVRFDEHTTATNGKYELKEGMEEELKNGTFNYQYNIFHKPVFPQMKGTVELQFRDSCVDALIRASDIIANQAWYHEKQGEGYLLRQKIMVVHFP